jgi:hypothetical protein
LTLSKIQTEKITLLEENYPINEGLNEHFPTLIQKGMKYYELKLDQTGEINKSNKPLRVSVYFILN